MFGVDKNNGRKFADMFLCSGKTELCKTHLQYQREVGSRNIFQNKQTNKQTNKVFPVALVTLLIDR